MLSPLDPDFAFTPVAPDRPRFHYAPAPASTRDDHPDSLDPWRRRPVVSVVTPYFNTGPIFHETARCVLGQSLQDFEWLIINDASTDPAALDTLDHYRTLAATDRRIRVIDHAVNHGLAATRNTGYRLARAGLIFQLDSDDLIEPTTVEKCALALHANPAAAFAKGNSVGFGAQQYLWEKGFHDGCRFLHDNLVTATAMVRKTAHRDAGGFDEAIRGGLEDWDFWVRCAALGHWGLTIPEFLDWYRRRPQQHADWENLASERRFDWFRHRLAALHPHLVRDGGWPTYPATHTFSRDDCPPDPPFANPLDKQARRLLLILPWFRMGGADKFNLDLTRFLTSAHTQAGAGWELTIATTVPSPHGARSHPWLHLFARRTPDIFILPHLAPARDHPRILRYLIESRRPDAVLLSNSDLAYGLLPFLRAHCPQPAYLDFNHMEEPHWRSGGHPRSGVGAHHQLDLSITVSHHLKRWMTDLKPAAVEPDRIQVCHINADPDTFRPDPDARARTRAELDIPADAPVILYAARLCAQKQPLVLADTLARLLHAADHPNQPSRDRTGPAEPPDQPRGNRNGVTTSSRATEIGFEISVLPSLVPTIPLPCLLIVGDGELRPDLERALDRLDLNAHVKMLGAVPTERIPALMAAADIFFLPSQWEGIALSIYEAMAAGLAVLSADVGGQRELVTPDTGILITKPTTGNGSPDLDAEAALYAQHLAALIADHPRRRALGAAARQRILDHFQLASMGARMLELFDLAAHLRDAEPRPALPAPLARELALQAVEQARLHDLCEELWTDRARLQTDLAAARAARDHLTAPRSRRSARDLEAELAHLTSARSFRAVAALKRLPPWSLYTRLKHGHPPR